jgi:hypothetical protein
VSRLRGRWPRRALIAARASLCHHHPAAFRRGAPDDGAALRHDLGGHRRRHPGAHGRRLRRPPALLAAVGRSRGAPRERLRGGGPRARLEDRALPVQRLRVSRGPVRRLQGPPRPDQHQLPLPRRRAPLSARQLRLRGRGLPHEPLRSRGARHAALSEGPALDPGGRRRGAHRGRRGLRGPDREPRPRAAHRPLRGRHLHALHGRHDRPAQGRDVLHGGHRPELPRVGLPGSRDGAPDGRAPDRAARRDGLAGGPGRGLDSRMSDDARYRRLGGHHDAPPRRGDRRRAGEPVARSARALVHRRAREGHDARDRGRRLREADAPRPGRGEGEGAALRHVGGEA